MASQVNSALYIACITFVAAICYGWLHFRVTAFKKKRVDRISRLVKEDPEVTAAIPTDVLSSKEEKQGQREIVQGVRTRFTIIRRAVILIIIAIWSLALLFPFVGEIPTTVISVLIAISTAVIGIAARPLVENMISGIVISFSNQIRVGDTLMVDDQYGTVEDISITHTKIKTWDWKRYVIPNSRMLNKEFTNLTLNDSLLWSCLEFSVSYNADMAKVEQIAIEIASCSEYHNAQETPQFWVRGMAKEQVLCWIAAWANSPADAWNLKSDIAIKLIKRLHDEGISTHETKVSLARE